MPLTDVVKIVQAVAARLAGAPELSVNQGKVS